MKFCGRNLLIAAFWALVLLCLIDMGSTNKQQTPEEKYRKRMEFLKTSTTTAKPKSEGGSQSKPVIKKPVVPLTTTAKPKASCGPNCHGFSWEPATKCPYGGPQDTQKKCDHKYQICCQPKKK